MTATSARKAHSMPVIEDRMPTARNARLVQRPMIVSHALFATDENPETLTPTAYDLPIVSWHKYSEGLVFLSSLLSEKGESV